MTTSVAKMVRVPMNPALALDRDLKRADEIRVAGHARVDAEWVQRIREAVERHSGESHGSAGSEQNGIAANGVGEPAA